nr:hypothetical protein [Tanacetum cinerariifolium]
FLIVEISSPRIMATTIEQQTALDESLVPKFWATAKLHHHSIRFKIDTRKSVLDLEAFREMMHISPRIPNQQFADLPTEEEVLDFLRFLGHSQDIRYLTDVEHKSQKRSNEMNYPRFTKVVVDYFMTRKPSISRRNRIPWHYVRDDALFSTIKVEYYACAMGEAAPKPKASARKKKGDSASSTTLPTPTPTTTAESAPRLSESAKGKRPLRATTPVEPTDLQRAEAEQLKIALKRSRQETHISQQSGSGTGEGTGSKPGVPDVPSDDSEEELSWKSSDDEEVGIRRALLMLEILSRRFFLKLNLSDHRSILTDLQETSKGNRGRYEHANPVSLKAQDGKDHMTMNRDYAWLMISRRSISSQTHVKDQANVKENQEKDKIGSKPDKNGKRGKAGKSLKQLQLKEEEKPKKKKRMAENAYTDQKLLNFKEKKKRKGPRM